MASNYDGYVGLSKSGGVVIGKSSKMDRARGAGEAFKKDYEGMKTSYETYKRADAPDSKTTEKQILQGSENAIKRVQGANTEADNERRRELNRSASNGKARMTTDDKKY